MSVDCEDEGLISESDGCDGDGVEYARIITCGDNNGGSHDGGHVESAYFMTTDRITIGRNSADGTVDIDVGPHTFVSRKHLEMMYSYRKLRIKCLGKNGIFIDNYFRAHSAMPYELPYECTLRFPSTNVRVNVTQLVGRTRCTGNEASDQHIDNRTSNRQRKRKATQLINQTFDCCDNDELYDSINYINKDITITSSNASALSDGPLRRSVDIMSDIYDGNTRSDLLDHRTMVESVIHNNSNGSGNIINHNTHHQRKTGNSHTIISTQTTCTTTVATTMNQKQEQQAPSIIDNNNNNNSSNHNFTTQTSTVQPTGKKLQNVCIEKSSNTIPQIVLNARPYRSYSYKGEVIYTHNSQVFSSIYDSKDLAIEYGTDTQKPPYSYAQLIVQAVSSSRDRQLTLNGIYNYISKHYPYFKSHDKGWQNSVRHNLSLNRYFIKVPRGQDEPGKGSFWRVDGAYESKLIAQAFRKRRLRSNNCGSICSENIPSASRVFSLSSGRAGSLCAVSDRNAKLNNIFTLRRAAGDQKAATTYVFRKMSDTQQLSENVFGSAKLISKQSDLNNPINTISPNNVFHNNNCNGKSNTSSKLGQKRIFQSPISMINKPPSNSNTNTIFSIGGKVFSTNKLKPIQLLSTKNSASFLSVKQQQQQSQHHHNHQQQQQQQQPLQNNNKYILISTSQIDNNNNQNQNQNSQSNVTSNIHSISTSNSNSNQVISITGSGTLNRHPEQPLSDYSYRNHIRPSNKSPIIHPILSDSQLDLSHYKSSSHQPISPLSVSETCEFALDEPSQLDSSSTELGPLSPGIKFSQSLQHDDDDDDDLDLEMDQFLDSYSILDQSNDIDSPADLYKEAVTDIDDYCVWQDECLGLQDVEIEIH